MDGGGNTSICMLEFDQLPNPELSQDLLNQLDAHIKGGNWKMTFECITCIRGICKFYPQHILDIFGKYGMVLLDLLDNGATQNIKNIIRLLCELFEQGQTLNIETLVAGFLPLIVKKASNESGGQIKEACQQLLTIVSNKCCYPRVI